MHSPVPAFVHSLKALSAILAKGEAHCAARKVDPSVMLTTRLFPDMLHFTRNVQIACDSAKGAAARLAGIEIPSYEDKESSFAELQARIQKTIDFMQSVPVDKFNNAEDRTINMKAGTRELTFVGSDYLARFATPNFYFHVTTAYNILRTNGVEVGKTDYLGG